MTETILVAVLSLLGTLAGAYFGNRRSTALLDYRLQQLEAKVDKHNQVIERTFALERRADVTEEQIKVVNHRISDLEEAEKHE